MAFSSLFNFLGDSAWLDPLVLWATASVAGILVLVTVASALDLFLESESEADLG